jgi:hypothetical protein
MLARAHADGASGLTFQAVGLEFEARDTFRSRALIVYGPVRSVDELRASGEELVKAITDRLREDLSELIVEGSTWEERRLIWRVAELFVNETADPSSRVRPLARYNEIGRQVEAARKALGDEALYREIVDAVGAYYAALEREGTTDEHVARGDAPSPSYRKRRKAMLALALPFAIPGAVLYALPYQLTRLVATRFAREERDVASTYKVGMGLVLYPLWAGGLTAASLALLPPPISFVATGVVLVSPFAALAWLDHLGRPRSAGAADLGALRAMRATVMARLSAARQRVEAA